MILLRKKIIGNTNVTKKMSSKFLINNPNFMHLDTYEKWFVLSFIFR